MKEDEMYEILQKKGVEGGGAGKSGAIRNRETVPAGKSKEIS